MPRASLTTTQKERALATLAAKAAIYQSRALIEQSDQTISNETFESLTFAVNSVQAIRVRKEKRPQMKKLMQTIYEVYRRGYPLEVIAKKIGVSSGAMSTNLRKLGFELRSPAHRTQHANPPYRQYTIDHHAFDEIEQQNPAYLLGLLQADGNITINKGRPDGIRFRIQARDAAILDNVKLILGSNAPIEVLQVQNQDGKWYWQAHLCVYSVALARRLIDLGLRRDKASHHQFAPPVYSAEARRHFWRGMVDGDGSIDRENVDRVKYPLSGWRIQFCGDYGIVTAFCHYVEEITGRKITPYLNGNSKINWSCTVPVAESISIARHLYTGATIALYRKKRIADALTAAWSTAKLNGVTTTTQPNGRRVFTNKGEADDEVHKILRNVISAEGRNNYDND
ncbi:MULTISPECIES: hypothetical protein [unclassified Thioalkalivibrio]|uniref:hypothetical protein n=1 Tax=unclassified Thioalkalivibrio TaxID=2621013 RepID=UPI0012DD8BED|nr:MULTISPECIES: hypothetical protein [unclassified Thioalkalivibrio]